jgi:hypothetical protein
VLAAVRTLNRMEFAGETLRAALEALAAAPGWLAPLTGSPWADRYGARTGSYRFPKGDDARRQRAGQAGRDGFTLLDAVGAPRAPAWLRQVPAVQTLRRTWQEQYHRDETGVRWREGNDLPLGGQRLASPYDLDARYGVKRGSGWTGYKAHLTETCDPDMPRVITDVQTTGATADDGEMTPAIHQHLGNRRLAPGEHVTDARYISAGHILTARADHGITLPGPAVLPARPGAAATGRNRPWPRPPSASTGTHGRSPAPRERSASAGPASANPAAPRSPGSTSRSPAAARARCGPGAPRRLTASGDAA